MAEVYTGISKYSIQVHLSQHLTTADNAIEDRLVGYKRLTRLMKYGKVR